MIKILPNLRLFCVKNANYFAEFFGKNIFKIITSVPGLNVTILKYFCRKKIGDLWRETLFYFKETDQSIFEKVYNIDDPESCLKSF
jgi:hypothetical protein